MLIKDITGTLHLKTKAASLLQLSTHDFFAQLLSLQGNIAITTTNPEYIEEVNSILTTLHNKDAIVVDFNSTFENKLLRTVDVYSVNDEEIILPRAKEQLLRKRKVIQQHVDLNVSAQEQELFLEQPDVDTIIAIRYLAKKRQAIMRGIEFKLTIQDFSRLIKTKRCYYSGATLTLSGHTAMSFDRKDSTIGYTKENTLACCALVNELKNSLVENHKVEQGLTRKEIKKMLLSFSEMF